MLCGGILTWVTWNNVSRDESLFYPGTGLINELPVQYDAKDRINSPEWKMKEEQSKQNHWNSDDSTTERLLLSPDRIVVILIIE